MSHKVVVLTGQSNYARWLPSLHSIAGRHFPLFTGAEQILEEPDLDMFIATAPLVETERWSSWGKSLPTDRQIAVLTTHLDAYKRYDATRHKYERQQDRVEQATGLLYSTLCSRICNEVRGLTLRDAFDLINTRYSVPESRMRSDAVTAMSRLKLSDCDGMRDYLERFEQLFEELTLQDDDQAMVSWMTAGLGDEYTEWTRQRAAAGGKNTVEDLKADLLVEDRARRRKSTRSTER